jgi:hypothetical protein
MATKKKAAATAPVDIPDVLRGEDDNKAIARACASLVKRWNVTKKETLLDTSDLAWFFVALRREREARELVDHVADRVLAPGDDPAAWFAASLMIALAARLARESNDEPRRASLVARLVAHPAVPLAPADALLRALADANKDIRSAEVEPSPKWACQWFARGCGRATYFRETAAEGGYAPGTVDVDALERTVSEGLAGLRAHLAR